MPELEISQRDSKGGQRCRIVLYKKNPLVGLESSAWQRVEDGYGHFRSVTTSSLEQGGEKQESPTDFPFFTTTRCLKRVREQVINESKEGVFL